EFMRAKRETDERMLRQQKEAEELARMAPLLLRRQLSAQAREETRRHMAAMMDRPTHREPRRAWVDPGPLEPEEALQLHGYLSPMRGAGALTAAQLRQRDTAYRAGVGSSRPDVDAVSLRPQPNATNVGVARELAGARMRITGVENSAVRPGRRGAQGVRPISTLGGEGGAGGGGSGRASGKGLSVSYRDEWENRDPGPGAGADRPQVIRVRDPEPRLVLDSRPASAGKGPPGRQRPASAAAAAVRVLGVLQEQSRNVMQEVAEASSGWRCHAGICSTR
ncbi:hypothetical protein HaLaN_31532, partial [Haematococcus lacustris]